MTQDETAPILEAEERRVIVEALAIALRVVGSSGGEALGEPQR